VSVKSDLSSGSRAVVDHDRETSHCYVPHLTRRQAIRSSLLSVVLSSLPLFFSPEPAVAAYIDPAATPPKITQRVYMDVLIGDKATAQPQRIVMGLYGDDMPRTVDNFVALVKNNGYAGTTFYRVLSEYTIQGGAIGDTTGKTGQSSRTGGVPFEPDNFNIKHSVVGLVSMVRGLSGAVDSRFFIGCQDDGGWADDRYAGKLYQSPPQALHTPNFFLTLSIPNLLRSLWNRRTRSRQQSTQCYY
jgi:peptidyl-prolyl cis-trans isomerase B (cyclophilin B)